jgi:hypothetical protein
MMFKRFNLSGRFSVREIICFVVIAAALPLLGQNRKTARDFPIPKHVNRTFQPVMRLSESERALLKQAIDTVEKGRSTDSSIEDCDGKPYFDTTAFASVSFGVLGQGLIIRSGHCSCGRTGNCPLWVFLREKTGFRLLADTPDGWAFGTIASATGILDLVFITNMGADNDTLSLYRYKDGKYVQRDEEDVENQEIH